MGSLWAFVFALGVVSVARGRIVSGLMAIRGPVPASRARLVCYDCADLILMGCVLFGLWRYVQASFNAWITVVWVLGTLTVGVGLLKHGRGRMLGV